MVHVLKMEHQLTILSIIEEEKGFNVFTLVKYINIFHSDNS